MDFDPSEIMQVRWLSAIQQEVPAIDFEDLNICENNDVKARQFAPEFSQKAYETMLRSDIVIGDYLSN